MSLLIRDEDYYPDRRDPQLYERIRELINAGASFYIQEHIGAVIIRHAGQHGRWQPYTMHQERKANIKKRTVSERNEILL